MILLRYCNANAKVFKMYKLEIIIAKRFETIDEVELLKDAIFDFLRDYEDRILGNDSITDDIDLVVLDA